MRTAIYAHGAPMIEVLLRGGADLEATNNVSAQPKEIFSTSNHAGLRLRFLRMRRFEPIVCLPRSSCQDGNTALHLAAERGNFHVVEKLLRNGADAKIKNSVRCPQARAPYESQGPTGVRAARSQGSRQ